MGFDWLLLSRKMRMQREPSRFRNPIKTWWIFVRLAGGSTKIYAVGGSRASPLQGKEVTERRF